MKPTFRRLRLRSYLCIVFALITSSSFSQSENSPRALALGGCDALLVDGGGVLQNPATLAYLQHAEATLSVNRNYFLRELDRQAFAVGIPFGKSGTLGLGLSRYGFDLYREQKAGICWSRNFGPKFSAAVQLGAADLKVGEGNGHFTAVFVKVGLLAKISSQVSMGAVIDNPEHAKLAEGKPVPSVFKLGMQIKISDNVSLYSQATQTLAQAILFSGGMEYRTSGGFFLQMGVKSRPLSPSMGVGFTKAQMRLQLAADWHPVLGVSPAVSFTYLFHTNN
jgi:hypothetical protein